MQWAYIFFSHFSYKQNFGVRSVCITHVRLRDNILQSQFLQCISDKKNWFYNNTGESTETYRFDLSTDFRKHKLYWKEKQKIRNEKKLLNNHWHICTSKMIKTKITNKETYARQQQSNLRLKLFTFIYVNYNKTWI